MSHVARIDVVISNLMDLEGACARVGLELVRGQTSFKYYANNRQECLHAIRVPGNDRAYEIGVVAREGGGFTLEADDYQGGLGMVELSGRKCMKLRQAYAIEAATRVARSQGKRVTERVLPNGSVQLVCA